MPSTEETKPETMPTTPQELKAFIKKYLEENMSIQVYTDVCCDDKELVVKVLLEDEVVDCVSEFI